MAMFNCYVSSPEGSFYVLISPGATRIQTWRIETRKTQDFARKIGSIHSDLGVETMGISDREGGAKTTYLWLSLSLLQLHTSSTIVLPSNPQKLKNPELVPQLGSR